MATWYIKDGDIPYLEEFPEMSEFNGYPDGLWRIVDGDIPFRNFPEMCDIDDAPDSLWRIIDGDIPFRNFPEICGIDDAPAFFWIIQEDSEYNKDTPYKKDIPFKSSFPAMYKVFREIKTTPIRKKIVMRTVRTKVIVDKPFTEGVALSKIYSNGESQIIRVDNAGLIKLQAIQDGRYQLVGKLYGETEYTPIAMIDTNGINNVRYGTNTDVYAADISGFEYVKVIVYYGCDVIYAKTDNVVMKYVKTITNKIILCNGKHRIRFANANNKIIMTEQKKYKIFV